MSPICHRLLWHNYAAFFAPSNKDSSWCACDTLKLHTIEIVVKAFLTKSARILMLVQPMKAQRELQKGFFFDSLLAWNSIKLLIYLFQFYFRFFFVFKENCSRVYPDCSWNETVSFRLFFLSRYHFPIMFYCWNPSIRHIKWNWKTNERLNSNFG